VIQRSKKLLAVIGALGLVAAACSSSSNKAATPSANAGGGTYTVGVLTDLTGPAASASKTSPDGVKAGTVLARRDGYTIKYVVADTGTSPTGALAAAQKLVTQDHVFAVIGLSALLFSAAPYLTAQHVPVVGAAFDGPEWITAKNMFSVIGAIHTTTVADTLGKFFKMEGVTNVGTLGYGVSPTSAEFAKSTAASAKAVGLKAGYVNANFPFGSTNVQPEAIAMKNAGVNGIYPVVDPSTGFALVTALRQAGAAPKVALLPTGFGGDLLQAGPGALQQAQNVYFTLQFEPVEMQTAATKQFSSDLKAAGITVEPSLGTYYGYTSIGLLAQGLKAAGPHPSQAGLITALSNIHNWDALGLWGGRTLDINNRSGLSTSAGNCVWVTKLVGNGFQVVPGAEPICGNLLPITVSPSS
jgi:ABC-type branched-subunit amino acid transport system substrate-binding protein